MLDTFKQTIQSITEIPMSELDKICEITTPKTVEKGGYFIRAGQIPNKFAFVSNGLFRYFYSDGKGKEYTKGFFPEYTFITAYSAMLHQRGSYFAIEALENSEILVISYQKWLELEKQHSCWTKMLLKLVEVGYCKKEARERELLLFDAETRYQNFIAEYPNLEKRLKQHMVASYLGITSVALSRVRKKMGLINPC